MSRNLTKHGGNGRGVLAVAAAGIVASALAYWLRSRQTETELTTRTRARLEPKLGPANSDSSPRPD